MQHSFEVRPKALFFVSLGLYRFRIKVNLVGLVENDWFDFKNEA